jgi:hypothetical protein
MDLNSSYGLAVRVGAYVKLTDDDGREYCKACNIPKILDRDSEYFQHMAQIGSPSGLVISTDAGKGIDSIVTEVFKNGVEHRECMRHLVANFKKRFRGEVFEKHLWPACRAYQRHKFEEHYNLLYEACLEAMKWIDHTHKHLWT